MAAFEPQQTGKPDSPVDPNRVVALYEAILDNLRRVMHVPEETIHLAVLCLLADVGGCTLNSCALDAMHRSDII